jgi:site-specific DNA-methyltransferase (adenine-specific)
MESTKIGKSTLYLGDCMEYMATLPDKAFDLAIVDPPYGIGASRPSIKDEFVTQSNGAVLRVAQPSYKAKSWDDEPAGAEYFQELERVSKHQIVWGSNFYSYQFKGVGRLVWDKMNDYSDQFDCEIAYVSMNNRTDIIRYMWAGMMQGLEVAKSAKKALLQQGNKSLNEVRIHPTQKPVKLYEWLLTNYAKPGQRILDTHLGSGSSAIAAHYMGYEFVGCELDPDYYRAACNRIRKQTAQVSMFGDAYDQVERDEFKQESFL